MNRHVRTLLWSAAAGIGLSLAGILFSGKPDALWREFPKWVLYSGAMGLIWGGTIYSLCVLPLEWLRRKLADYPPAVIYALTACAAVIVGSMAGVIAFQLTRLLPGIQVTSPFSLLQIAIIDGVLGVSLALIFTGFELVKKSTAEKEAHHKLAIELRSQVLQSQINPHFFFNTLNTISSLIESRPQEAKEVLARLADLFRYSLKCTQDDMVPLEKELAFVKDYLSIEQARFRDRLRVHLPEQVPAVQLPGLTLQPLVENAVRYGVAPCVEGGDIDVLVESRDGLVAIVVRNRGCEVADLRQEQVFRPGHALANIRDRLQLRFAGRASLTLEQENADWVRATVTVPQV